MMHSPCIKKVFSSTAGVFFQRYTFLRRPHRLATQSICVVSWLTYQSNQMMQYRCQSDSKRPEKNCPLCQQFGHGPCKDVFYAWYDCTEEAAASERSEDEITQDCAKAFDDFRTCLEKHSNTMDVGTYPPNPEDLLQLQDAWHQIIYYDLASVRRVRFPAKTSPLIEKGSDNWLVSFSRDKLVLVFVERELQNGDKELVSAASVEDLVHNTLRIPTSRLQGTITVSALYETGEDNAELVVCEEKIVCHNS